MTLWMVLLVVAVAWSSGTVFGWGLKELVEARTARRGGAKPAGVADAPEAGGARASSPTIGPAQPASQPAGATSAPAAPPEQSSRRVVQARSVSKGEGAAAPPLAPLSPLVQTTRIGAEAGVIPQPQVPGGSGPAGSDRHFQPQTKAPAVPSLGAVSPEGAPEDSPVAEPAQAIRPGAAALAARAPAVKAPEQPADPGAARDNEAPRTVSSVRVEDEPLALPIGGRKPSAPSPRSADYWRMLDRKNERPGLTFWIEIVVLVLLLAGACWGVIYFATQPVRAPL